MPRPKAQKGPPAPGQIRMLTEDELRRVADKGGRLVQAMRDRFVSAADVLRAEEICIYAEHRGCISYGEIALLAELFSRYEIT